MSNRFGLHLQCLPSASERVLVIGALLTSRSPDGRFSSAEVRDAFLALNVPPPSNVSDVLARLRRTGRVIQHGKVRWALTPLGVEAAGSVTETRAVESAEAPAAEFAHTDHTVIPAWAAPPRWAAGIGRLLERHPFDSNVFCMTRFPSEGGVPDPVADATLVARETLARFGLTLHLATDSIVDDDLLGNVGAYMWGCRYGLGFIEDRVGRGLNYNAVIELGGMALTGRRCAILKDWTVNALPTDLSGQIYRCVDLDKLVTVADEVEKWACSDLGFGAQR